MPQAIELNQYSLRYFDLNTYGYNFSYNQIDEDNVTKLCITKYYIPFDLGLFYATCHRIEIEEYNHGPTFSGAEKEKIYREDFSDGDKLLFYNADIEDLENIVNNLFADSSNNCNFITQQASPPAAL